MVAEAALVGGLVPRGTRVEVFQRIFWFFLGLGTLVGVIVVTYTLYNAYRYRDGRETPSADVDRPTLGELPEGGGGGRKLFTSFALSTIIVVALIVWTYGTLLYVEQAQASPGQEEALEVEVVGSQFQWQFVYPNGATTSTLRVPEDRRVNLRVTSTDVFHNFGIPALRAKTDAIPGQYTTTWFEAAETGTYQAHCYELCGAGHSAMDADVVVMEPDAFQEWYVNSTEA